MDRGSTTFLKLLHVSIFEAAIQYTPSVNDMFAIHLLLTTLVQTLGTHAVVSGIPMIYKLQSDTASIKDQNSQVALSSVVAGYLVSVGHIFGLEDVKEGVGMEIKHRQEHGHWLNGISYPPNDIPSSPLLSQDNQDYYPMDQDSPIPPFKNQSPLVDDLCKVLARETPNPDATVAKFRDALIGEWSRDSVMAELESRSSRQTSVTESRLAGNGTLRNYLGVTGVANGRPGSTTGSHHHHHSRPTSKHGGIGSSPGLEKFKVRAQTTGGSTPQSSSSRSSTVRVDELKKVLTGQSSHPQAHHTFRDDSSSGSECQSYTSSDGEELVAANRGRPTLSTLRSPSAGNADNNAGNVSYTRRAASLSSRRGTVGSEAGVSLSGARSSTGRVDQAPPLPRMPTLLHFPGSFPGDEVPVVLNSENGNANITDTTLSPVSSDETPARSPSSEPGTEMGPRFTFSEHHHHQHYHTDGSLGSRRVDVQGLLSGIDGSLKKRPVSRGVAAGMFRPPY